MFSTILTERVKKISIDAVKALGGSFGGVDVLPKGDGYVVTEANFPCNFARAQMYKGTDFSGMMLDSLISKMKKSSAE